MKTSIINGSEVSRLSVAIHSVEIVMYGSRLFKANFNAVLISNLDCKELKSELCDLAKKYRSNLDSGVGIEKIMEEMESARTIKELIKVFG
ncbi:hypothetical protein [Citrobacter braakii]|uniref:hypothetical protein n=1 Tax=Citrobacter braakii TaxID=57706 RepID=UPI002E15C1E2